MLYCAIEYLQSGVYLDRNKLITVQGKASDVTGKNPAKATDSQGLIAEVAAQFADIKAFFICPASQRALVSYFYLLGPLFLLIERSPADFWLSLCGLVFLAGVLLCVTGDGCAISGCEFALLFGVCVFTFFCHVQHANLFVWERHLCGYVFRSLPLPAVSGWQKAGR